MNKFDEKIRVDRFKLTIIIFEVSLILFWRFMNSFPAGRHSDQEAVWEESEEKDLIDYSSMNLKYEQNTGLIFQPIAMLNKQT